jgi:nucleoside-diphosphate-sugar epimerase
LRLLLTGHGRLGSPLLAELQRRGITGTVLLHRSDAPSLPPGWRSVRADVTSPASLAGVCADCDEVLHLAGLTHSNRAARYREVNTQGTANLIAE